MISDKEIKAKLEYLEFDGSDECLVFAKPLDDDDADVPVVFIGDAIDCLIYIDTHPEIKAYIALKSDIDKINVFH